VKVIAKTGRGDLAIVYVAKTREGKLIEFVESLQPPLPRKKKWILIVSTLNGCPVSCQFCDAGSYYHGKLSKNEIISQIDYLVTNRFPDRKIPVEKFKIQFARLGEPSFNQNVLSVLENLPKLYDAPGFLPSVSTIAPNGTDVFFERLIKIKKEKYKHRFQFQFSVHTTDEQQRDLLIPVKKWDFKKMAEYGERFHDNGGTKISLNFALSNYSVIDPNILLEYFNPNTFIIKVTPVNPTYQATRNNIHSILPHQKGNQIIETLLSAGYEVIKSIGEFEENFIGSNCGQYISNLNKTLHRVGEAYSYKLEERKSFSKTTSQ
jgi:23S rRNA (adenine2503-C2)-methyltransferase